MADIFILDASSAFTLADMSGDGTAGLDSLFEGDRRVVVTDDVLDEIRNSDKYGQKVVAWFTRNHNRIESFPAVDPTDMAKYNPTGKLGQRGDVSIKKFLAGKSSSADYYTIVSEDKDLRALRGPNYRATESTTGYLAEAIADKRISEAEAVTLSKNLGASSRLNNITPEQRDIIFTEEDILNHFKDTKSAAGAFSGAAKNGFKASALAAGAKLLHKVGIVGAVLSFGMTAVKAAELRATGKPEDVKKANKLWTEFIFENAGGALGAYLAVTTLKGRGGFWGPIVGAVAGSVAGAYEGAALGTYVYDQFPDVFDGFINPIYKELDALSPSPELYLSVDGSVWKPGPGYIQNSPDFVVQVAAKFGFQVDVGQGGPGNDLLLATKWTHSIGNGGDDVLVGWQPKALKAGDVFDPDLQAEAQRDWTAYDAALKVWTEGGSVGPGPAVPTLDRNAGMALKDLSMMIDGGIGDDWVLAIGGEKAITIGGAGRDWIYNSSKGGTIYGDTLDGLDPVTHLTIRSEEAAGTDVDANGRHRFADDFWWSSDTTIMDAGHYDVLKFFGISLVGGDSGGGVTLSLPGLSLLGAAIGAAQANTSIADTIYIDQFLPFIVYRMDYTHGRHDLVVANLISAFLDAATAVLGGDTHDLDKKIKQDLGVMRIKNFDFVGSYSGFRQEELANQGTLGMVFKKANPIFAILAHLPETLITFAGAGAGPLVDAAASALAAANRLAKSMKWSSGSDPLVLDLGGDGIATTSLDGSSIHFDLNTDFFSERTGWLDGSDGFLVLDRNGNGLIDDAGEMFGTNTGSGFADLAAYDSNHDGVIDSRDAIFSKLQVWTDTNGDGVTDPGELHSLSDLGIASISLASTAIGATTPQGNVLRSWSRFTRTDGTTGAVYEAIFATDQSDTAYRGEAGRPSWAPAAGANIKGFGRLTSLAGAAANDFGLAALVASRAAQMTTPDLRTLVAQAGDVLGAWGETQPLTRELTPVLLSADGKTLVDRAVYVEDAAGGYWTLASGGAVRDAGGNAIARPTMEQVLAQATSAGAHWQIEQAWSPTSRGAALHFRAGAPYLTQVVDGRAVVLDYGIAQGDGSWRLASGRAVTDAAGQAIASPTLADILAQAHAGGTEWRTEALGFNALANIPVQNIGIDIVDGSVADYTVQVTDRDGTFYVWARNLDRALALQAKQGNARAFNLRNYAVDFAKLQQQVNATDDSAYRIELLTPAQFNFALEMSSITFQPQMLSASSRSGQIAVNENFTVEEMAA